MMAQPPVLEFAGLLRQLRAEARLTQEELAEAAGLSPRSVSDLERGINRTARKDTALLLADALGLADPVRALFVAAARGRGPAAEVLAAGRHVVEGTSPDTVPGGATAPPRTLPRDLASFTGRQQELRELVEAAAGAGRVVGIHAIGGMARTHRIGHSPATPWRRGGQPESSVSAGVGFAQPTANRTRSTRLGRE